MSDFYATYFGGRVYPSREFNSNRQTESGTGYSKYAQDFYDGLGHTQQAQYFNTGTLAGNNLFGITAGFGLQGPVGINMSVTVAAASGSLTVTSNGLDITIQPAAGGSTAAAVVAAINAAFSPLFVKAFIPNGNAGGSNIPASVAKTYFLGRKRPAA